MNFYFFVPNLFLQVLRLHAQSKIDEVEKVKLHH